MTTQLTRLPAALERHLASSRRAGLAGVGRFIEQGSSLVDARALAMLREQRLSLQLRISALGDSERLRRRLELLAALFDEAATEAPIASDALQEIAFALLYFMRNADRIPDAVPQIGLLDDALVAQFVLRRQAAAIGLWARRRGWALPPEAA